MLLAKIGESQWIQALRERGTLRMRQLRYYTRYDGNLVIGDPNDGVAYRHSTEVSPIIAQFGNVRFPLKNATLNIHAPERRHAVYCMMGLEPVVVEGGLDLGRTVLPAMESRRLREFGNTILLMAHSDQFTDRLLAAARKVGFELVYAPVKYVRMDHTGPMGPFAKFESYAYQQEVRFITDKPCPEFLDLELGSLEDISVIGSIQEPAAYEVQGPPEELSPTG